MKKGFRKTGLYKLKRGIAYQFTPEAVSAIRKYLSGESSRSVTSEMNISHQALINMTASYARHMYQKGEWK